MNGPSSTRSEDERTVDPHDVCLAGPRLQLAKQLGAVLETETISHSEKFGYIFRYEILGQVADEDGKTKEVKSILVLWRTIAQNSRGRPIRLFGF